MSTGTSTPLADPSSGGAADRAELVPGRFPSWGRRLAAFIAFLTFCVAVAGGAVTSTDSGLADEHWPSFDGSLLPSLEAMRTDRGKFFEHGHRIIAGLAVVGTWVVAFVVCRYEKRRRWVRRLAGTAAFVAPVPAVFGGLTVLYKLPPVISIVHVSVAMLLVAFNVTTAIVVGRGWFSAASDLGDKKPLPEDISWLATMSVWLALTIYAQIVLGAVPRHLYTGVMVHILWAFVVFTLVVVVASRVFSRHARVSRVVRPALALVVLVFVQFFLGISAFVSRPKAADVPATPFHELIASVHQMAGVLMLVAGVFFLLRAQRFKQVLQSFDSGDAAVRTA